MLSNTNMNSPHLGMLALEPIRAMLEFTRMRFAGNAPSTRGDGHAVVFFPGLGADHRFMEPLARHCERMGYASHHWGRGVNTGPTGDPVEWLNELASEITQTVAPPRKGMTLIGWSLGGFYAREIAKLVPDRVRQVITLGTPFASLSRSTNVEWLFQLLNGSTAIVDEGVARSLSVPPPVPTTSIYSRSDGVVAWEACLTEPGPLCENIEVESSHLGLVWHPDVLRIVADRLAQRPNRWRPWAGDDKARAAIAA